ncbi:hypothetical protein QTI66_37455 [Variovorax sp. J22R133]|uniref:hypothetical protein n=1 Tax=Variovorax brevis TaxID=3053503 RepID=UPI0025774132|nr:hypothetical protein [Variovorax sp. J22R133]MDM0117788.1 hypothetical protein [Variovorax sp. J22R133]
MTEVHGGGRTPHDGDEGGLECWDLDANGIGIFRDPVTRQFYRGTMMTGGHLDAGEPCRVEGLTSVALTDEEVTRRQQEFSDATERLLSVATDARDVFLRARFSTMPPATGGACRTIDGQGLQSDHRGRRAW